MNGVVEHFNVVEGMAARSLPCGIGFLTDTFAFEQLEEVFCHGIVVAVTASTAYCSTGCGPFKNFAIHGLSIRSLDLSEQSLYHWAFCAK